MKRAGLRLVVVVGLAAVIGVGSPMAALAADETIWSASMTVGIRTVNDIEYRGYYAWPPEDHLGTLSTDSILVDGTDTATILGWHTANDILYIGVAGVAQRDTVNDWIFDTAGTLLRAGDADFFYKVEAGSLWYGWWDGGGVKAQDWEAGDLVPLTIRRPLPPPPAPGQVPTPTIEERDGALTASWSAPASEKPITHYHVDHKAIGSTGKWLDQPTSVTATTHEIKGLTNGTPYVVRVRAVNSAGTEGPWSESGSGTPAAAAAAEEEPEEEEEAEEEPMPTPALPIVGVLALAAGLLTAGRRRLARR